MKKNSSTLVTNKQARKNYEIIKTYEAGIQLLGWEVKSIKNSDASLEGSFVKEYRDDLYIIGLTVKPWKMGFQKEKYDSLRTKKILLHKSQIKKIKDALNQKGYSVIPLKLYLSKNLVKAEIGIVRGLKKHDKRKRLKEKETKKRVSEDRIFYNI